MPRSCTISRAAQVRGIGRKLPPPNRRIHQCGSRACAWKWSGIWRMCRSTDQLPAPSTSSATLPEMLEHRFKLVLRRIDGVSAPDDHGHTAYLAFGDPAELVVVVPGGQTRRFAELARPTPGDRVRDQWR